MSYHTDNQYGDGGQQGEYEGRQGRAYSRKPSELNLGRSGPFPIASPLVNRNFANKFKGPVTDYGSSMVQWIRNRGPRHKGFPKVEVERPSASYIVDVCRPIQTLTSSATIPGYRAYSACRCFHPLQDSTPLPTRYLSDIFILPLVKQRSRSQS